MKEKIHLPSLRPLLIILPVTFLNSLFFNWFYVTNHIAYGGVTGIAQVVNRLFGFPPIGVLIILLNIPLFLLGWRFFGGSMLIISLCTMVTSSVSIDLVGMLVSFEPVEPLLACIYGGLTNGVTMGVILRQGGSFGGSDLGARLLKLRFQWLPVGRLMLALDLTVISVSALTARDLDQALYGLVALYISTLAMDNVIYGMDKSDVAYIISDKYSLVAAAIIQDLHRGITLLQGHGAWSGDVKQVIMVAVKRRQIIQLKQMVKDIDPKAFIIVCSAHEVLGSGFHFYQKNEL